MNIIAELLSPITAPIRFIQSNFKTVLFLSLIAYFYFNSDARVLEKPNLAIISLDGTIINSDDVVQKINQAKEDNSIKGVLFKVNSPGGSVAPSVEISYAIKELKSIKPVIVYASGTMASGSYYASIWADKIVANPGSMIGSIGVIMQSFDASKLLNKIGVKPQVVKMGIYKEAGTPMRVWSDAEKNELKKVIKSTYDMFVQDVSTARKLKLANKDNFANAHIFTSSQAKEVGLIDEVATISKAKKDLVVLSDVKKPIWQKEDKIDKFMQKIVEGTILHISNNLNGLLAY